MASHDASVAPSRACAAICCGLAYGAAAAGGAAAARSSRATTPGTSASTGCRWRATRRRSIRSIGADVGMHADFGSGHVGRRDDRHPDHGRRRRASRRCASRSTTRTSPTGARTRSRANVAIEGGRRPARADRRPRRPARSTSCTRSSGAAAAGRRARARSGACARTGCARRAGPRPTPPACRSCRASRATTRSRAARIDHALRFTADAHAARVRLSRRATSRATRPTRPAADGPARAPARRASRRRGFPPQARVVLEALKRYGMILADNGSTWYVTGAPDPRWNNDDLHALGRVTRRRLRGRRHEQAPALTEQLGVVLLEDRRPVGALAGVERLDQLVDPRRHHEQVARRLGDRVPVGVRRAARRRGSTRRARPRAPRRRRGTRAGPRARTTPRRRSGGGAGLRSAGRDVCRDRSSPRRRTTR